jgi:outer membrane protein TolC
VGTLVTWEPFDFGLRGANEGAAVASRTRSEAAVKRTEFEVASAAADAYLTLVAAQETVRAANAGVERAETLARVIRAQADAQLRPGADASRAEAEMAAARTQAIQAGRSVDIARINLAQFVGTEPGAIAVTAPALLAPAPDQPVAPLNLAANPLSVEQAAVVEQLTAQLRALGRSYFPHFALQAAAFARGTGAQVNGNNMGGLNGLAPSTQNYGIGFSVTFPLFDLPAIRAREAAQSAAVRAEAARLQQIATELKTRWNSAVATLDGARRVAVNTPVQVSAARAASDQAMARYRSGLGNIEAVADAQRLLTQAEIDDALARLGVWRALLGVAIAAGDIEPFVAEAGR